VHVATGECNAFLPAGRGQRAAICQVVQQWLGANGASQADENDETHTLSNTLRKSPVKGLEMYVY
jgi:hypothetical protein